QTQTTNDFWDQLEKTLRSIVGIEPGRNVVVNPQAGIVVVRAMPAEIRGVESYLKAIRLSVERQVGIGAKIIEVTLNNQFQTGINWAVFSSGGLSAGPVSTGTVLQKRGAGGGLLGTGGGTISRDANGNFNPDSSVLAAKPGSNLVNINLA